MAHLTYFETFEEYNNYRNSEEYVEPNITFCLETERVYFDDDFAPTVEAVFTTTQANELVKLADNINDIIEIRIDDDTVIQPTSTYTFETAGEHKVEYMTYDFGVIPENTFKNLSSLTAVDLSKVSSLCANNFNNCTGVTTFGTDTFNFDVGDYCFVGVNETQYTKLTINGNIGSNSFYFSSSTCSLTDIEVNGNILSANFYNLSTITGMTINGNIGGGGNFNGTEGIKSFELNGNYGGGGNSVRGDSSLDAVFSVSGDITGGGDCLYSAGTITVSGNVSTPGAVLSARRIDIFGNITNGYSNYSGMTLSQSDSSIIHIYGDMTYYNGFYCNELIIDGDAYGVQGSISGTATVNGSVNGYSFGGMQYLTSVTIGGSIGENNFSGNLSALTEINLTGNCVYINSVPTGTSEVKITINTTTPPTLNAILTEIHKIYVPAEALETYKTTGNWVTYADKIYAME